MAQLNSAKTEFYYLETDEFFFPRLSTLENASKQFLVENLLSCYRLDCEQIAQLQLQMSTEIRLGLSSNPERPSVFPMVNTFVTGSMIRAVAGRSKEEDDFLGLDIGGTNLRVVYLKFNSSSKDRSEGKNSDAADFTVVDCEEFDVPLAVRQGTTGVVFFAFLAARIQEFLERKEQNSLLAELRKTKSIVPLGFTFSFGYEQFAINRGSITKMGSHTYLPDIFKQCPVQLLQTAVNHLQLPVKVVALANDATATLVYAAYLDPAASIGLILGSGTNIAYLERVDRFEKEKCGDFFNVDKAKQSTFIVNSEFPGFGDSGEMDYAKTPYDHLLDAASLVPKAYTYVKLTGGAHLGELLRLTLLDLVNKVGLFAGKVSGQLATKGAIASADISRIEAEFVAEKSTENTMQPLNNKAKVVLAFLENLGYPQEMITADDVAILRFAGQLITTRAALLIATPLSVFVEHMCSDQQHHGQQKQTVKIGCDGSLYAKHPKMARLINGYLAELLHKMPTLPACARVKGGNTTPHLSADVFLAQQGSSIGVALIAAAAITATTTNA